MVQHSSLRKSSREATGLWQHRGAELDSEKIMVSTDGVCGQKFADASSRATLQPKRDDSGMATNHSNVERESKETIGRGLLSNLSLASRVPARHRE